MNPINKFESLKDLNQDLFVRTAIANDASHYLLTPKYVAKPHSASQMADIFKISHKNKLSITFRSGGTSLSGQAVTDSILVDTRRNFKEIEILEEGMKVRVQPGLTINRVNAALKKYGRKLGPDPASEIACTIGGVVANNSSGMACGTQFNAYSTLASLNFVLASGTQINTADKDADEQLRLKEPEIYTGLLDLKNRIEKNSKMVEKIESSYAIKNTMGYGLNSFTDFAKPIDILAHLLIGSEGTLAFISEVTFNTIPLYPYAATGLLIFDNLEQATASLTSILQSSPTIVELLDISSLLVAQREHMADSVLAQHTFSSNAAFLVEYQEESENKLNETMQNAKPMIAGLTKTSGEFTTSLKTRNELWYARKGLYAAVAGNRAPGTTALLEDISVPVNYLHETTVELRNLLNKHKYHDSVIFGHAKDGNLHFLLNEKFDDTSHLQRYESFTGEMVDLVLSQEGSLKAEHGTGRIMAPYVKKQFGADLYQIMVDLKKLIDPKNILNPGIIINENENIHIENLKISVTVDQEIDKCVECGYCETVCPSKDLTLTPKQRIILRRARKTAEKINDFETIEAIDKSYDYQAIDTCAVDGMCAVACPVHINTGDLVKRLRTEQQNFITERIGYFTAKYWNIITKLLSWTLSLTKILPSALVKLVNIILRSVVGKNSIPSWNKKLPSGGLPRQSLITASPDVIYFPSCINTIYGEENIEEAFLSLCQKAGIKVTIPQGIEKLCCATPWNSKGLWQGYEQMAFATKTQLSAHQESAGIAIVSDSTSCTQGLSQIFEETPIKILDLVEFTAKEILPKLNILKKISSITLHPTCSGVETGSNEYMKEIANFISDDVFIPLDWNCCGFAGDRGLLHPEFTQSATLREATEVKQTNTVAYASNNKPCQIALSQATDKKYQHIIHTLNELI